MFSKRGLNFLDEESLRGDEDATDMSKILELTQALRMNLALSYFKMGECKEALNLLNRILDAQPKHIKALYIRGKVLLQMGETEDAIKSLKRSLDFDPNNTVSEILTIKSLRAKWWLNVFSNKK